MTQAMTSQLCNAFVIIEFGFTNEGSGGTTTIIIGYYYDYYYL